MFIIADQLRVNLIIGGVDAAEDVQNLQKVTIKETSGGKLPRLSIVMTTRNEDLVRKLNERSDIEVGLGDDSSDMASSLFVIQKSNIQKVGNNFWLLSIEAIKSSLIPWMKNKVEISEEVSGIERIRTVAARADNVTGNIEKSADKQRWIQYGCPDRVHVNDIWLHCDVPGSFPVLANTLEDFRIHDARAKFASAAGDKADWTFSPHEADINAGAIAYDISQGVENINGMFNSFGARGHNMQEYSLDDGTPSLLTSDPLGLANAAPDVREDFDKISNRRHVRSRNVHEKYWASKLHNHTQLGLHSSSRLTISWRDLYEPVRALDSAMFRDRDILEDDERSVESYSGLYLVSRVIRAFNQNSFTTTIQLVRESIRDS